MKVNSRESLQTGAKLIKEFGSWDEVETHSRRNKHGVYVVVREDRKEAPPPQKKTAKG